MARILDQNGKPIEIGQLSEIQTDQIAKLGAMHSIYAGHPSRGLTPARLARILEQAEQGDIVAQHDLFIDMEEKDGHIYAEMSKRKRALLPLEWKISPPRNATSAEQKQAEYIEEALRDLDNFEDLLLDMLDAIGHGFSCVEIEWEMLGREWLPKAFTHRPQSWFQTDRETHSQIRLRDNSLNGAALWQFGWITHVHRAKSGYLSRAGLHRVLAWPFLFKNFSVRDLAEFLEIYGLPLRLGTYSSGASDDEKATLLRAVTQIGHDAAGIIPEGMAIDFKEAAKGGSDPFQSMMDWCERTQSKAILGGTLTSQADGKSSTNALGNVHNEVRHDLLEADAKQVASTLTRDLIYPILALNLGGIDDRRRLPRFRFDTVEPEDIQTISSALPNLVDVGVQIPVDWVNEKLRIPLPAEGGAVLARVNSGAVTAPASATGTAALTSQNASGGEHFMDAMVNAAAGEWEQVMQPLLSPVKDALQEALASGMSLTEFAEVLPTLLARMDNGPMVDLQARAAFFARALGDAGIDLEP